jgi:hypothetical protein
MCHFCARRDATPSDRADPEALAAWLRTIRERLAADAAARMRALSISWQQFTAAAAEAAGPNVAATRNPSRLMLPRDISGYTMRAEGGTSPKAAAGYSVRGARGLVRWVIEQLLKKTPDLTEADRRRLSGLSPHAFHHTFGTQSVATDVPLDVVQQLLGHASLQTTSVYVAAEEKRRRAEIAKYHARLLDRR